MVLHSIFPFGSPSRLRLIAAGALLTALVPAPSGIGQVNEKTPGWFRFTMSPVEAPAQAAMDMSFLNRPDRGRIRVHDGHFVDAAGRRIRFLGTNFTFSGAFPEKSDAPALARRLAQLGFNVVRFHHMDARDIWLPNQSGLDPKQLDRLAWFLSELHRNGVYANINLHVSRTYPLLRHVRNLPRSYRYGKILDIFYEPFIRLQQEYARALLGYKNPYTGKRLADDPEVAFVELNNENTLLHLRVSMLAGMPAPFRSALRAKWRAWLKQRYASLSAAYSEWNRGTGPLGAELLRNGDFSNGGAEWVLEGRQAGVCDMQPEQTAGGRPGLKVQIRRKGRVPWAYQLHQIGLPIQNGQAYTIAFRIRAVPARAVGVCLRFSRKPWTVVSRHFRIQCTAEWREHVLVTRVAGVVPEIPIRLSFNMGDRPGAVEFAAISLRPGQRPFKARASNLDALDLPDASWPETAAADFRRFLIQTEQDYVRRMRRFLRDRLGVKALIVDTQAPYGGYWGLVRAERLDDYVDNHSYWQHPHFPGRPWDSRNWFIPNTSMVSSSTGGTLRRLTLYRAWGKPYSVSEYNHPFPNDHSAEMFPMISTYGAWQDWDAIYQFSYLNRRECVRRDRISSYFELCHHAAQLVFAPMAAVAFRAGGVAPAVRTGVARIPLPVLDRALATGYPTPDSLFPASMIPIRALLATRFGVVFSERGGKAIPPAWGQFPATGALLSGPEIEWNATPAESALYRVVSPSVRVAVGRIGGRSLALGDVRLTVKLPPGAWACAALAGLDQKAVAESGRLLFAIATHVENSDMEWQPQRKSILNHWGHGPVVAQGVPAELELPLGTARRAWALDARGVRSREVPVQAKGDRAILRVGPEYRTLWYLLER